LINKLITFGLDKSWRRLVVKRSELKEGGTGLDVCCGTGMLAMDPDDIPLFYFGEDSGATDNDWWE
jgi:ubiquinone/menaquinone biosynthesis C-methylase UbiE